MATKANDSLTAAVPRKEKSTIPMVDVLIPLQENDGSMKVEQAETVIINGKTTRVQRGVHVQVPVPVFIQLRNKYPNL